ncbi:MAG: helix-turn-helix transcriptional regulator [Clostridia bacterium]|jgi:DNA-binding XRE family transcriptional regulator|nr:helix-turn-helix transcriptional regulator [Clostridia bacterium]
MFEDLIEGYTEYKEDSKKFFLNKIRKLMDNSIRSKECQYKNIGMNNGTIRKILEGDSVEFTTFTKFLAYYGYEVEFLSGDNKISLYDVNDKVKTIGDKYLEKRGTSRRLHVKKGINIDEIREAFTNDIEKYLFAITYKNAAKRVFGELNLGSNTDSMIEFMDNNGIIINASNYNRNERYDLKSYDYTRIENNNRNRCNAYKAKIKHRYINELGYTQEDMANILGVNVDTVNKMINARGGSLANNVKLLKLLGYTTKIVNDKFETVFNCSDELSEIEKNAVLDGKSDIYKVAQKLDKIENHLVISGEEFYKKRHTVFGTFETIVEEEKETAYSKILKSINGRVGRANGYVSKNKIKEEAHISPKDVNYFLYGRGTSIRRVNEILNVFGDQVIMQKDGYAISLDEAVRSLGDIDNFVDRSSSRKLSISSENMEKVLKENSVFVCNMLANQYPSINFPVLYREGFNPRNSEEFFKEVENAGYKITHYEGLNKDEHVNDKVEEIITEKEELSV